MGLRISDLVNLGYKEEVAKLAEKLKENHEAYQYNKASKWASISGMKVNYSFFDVTDKKDFSKKEVEVALKQLGVNVRLINGKKWWEFWKNDSEVWMINAIKKIR